MATKPEGEVGLARMGVLFGEAGKMFQLKRVQFVRAVRPDRVEDPLALGLEPLKTSVIEEAKTEMDAGGDAAAPRVDLYPEDRVQLGWRRVRPACSGLVNPHTTCFMNASLQVLFQLPPMVAWMEDLQRQSGGGGGFTGRLLRLFARMHNGKDMVEAGELCQPSVIGQICSGHSEGKMEDAQEWLMGLLGKLHDEAVEQGTRGLRSTRGAVTPETEYTSFLYRIFGGKICTQISCRKEGFTKDVKEHFASLEIELGKARTLEQALASYTKREFLHGDNKYRLEYGPGKNDFKMVDAVKRITISKCPNVLMVLLKRFPMPNIKNGRQVDFRTTLEMNPYLSEDAQKSGSHRYDLAGVVVHSGNSTQTGHYFTYAKAANGIWHHFDDEKVQPVPESVVLNAQAYVLIYIRQKPSVQPKPKDIPNTSATSQAQSSSVKEGSSSIHMGGSVALTRQPGHFGSARRSTLLSGDKAKPEAPTHTALPPKPCPVSKVKPTTLAEPVAERKPCPASTLKPGTLIRTGAKPCAGAKPCPGANLKSIGTARTSAPPEPKLASKSRIPANCASPNAAKARASKAAVSTSLQKSTAASVKTPIKAAIQTLQKKKMAVGKSGSAERMRAHAEQMRKCRSAERPSGVQGDTANASDRGEYITSLFGAIQVRRDIEYASDSSGGEGASPFKNPQRVREQKPENVGGSKGGQHPSQGSAGGPRGSLTGKKRSLSQNDSQGLGDVESSVSLSVKRGRFGGVEQCNVRGKSKLGGSDDLGPSPFAKARVGTQGGCLQRRHSLEKSPVNRRLSDACRKLSMDLSIKGSGTTEFDPISESPSRLSQTQSLQLPKTKQTEKPSNTVVNATHQPSNELTKKSGAGSGVQRRKSASSGRSLVNEPRSMLEAVRGAQQKSEKPDQKVGSFVETGEDACSWLQGRSNSGGLQKGWSRAPNNIQSTNKLSLKRDRSEFDAEYNEEYDRGKTKKKKTKKKLFSSGCNEFQSKFDSKEQE